MVDNSIWNQEDCFVIMPIGDKDDSSAQKFDEIYQYLIKVAVNEAGLTCKRADEILKPGTIILDIVEYLARSNIVIADLTGQNPNVFYEMGVRDGVKGRMILLAQSLEDVPFDLRGSRIVIYSLDSPKNIHEAKVKIINFLKELMSDTETRDTVVREYIRDREIDNLELTTDNGLKFLAEEIRSIINSLNVTSAELERKFLSANFHKHEENNLESALLKLLEIVGPDFARDVQGYLRDIKQDVGELKEQQGLSHFYSEFGLESIYRNRLNAVENSIFSRMEKETKQIDIVGSTIFGLRGHDLVTPQRVIDLLKNKLATINNFRIRILLTHFEYLTFRQEQEKPIKRPERFRINDDAIQGIKALEEAELTNNVKFYKGAPTCFTIVCHNESKMLLNPYPYEHEAYRSWCIVVRDVPEGIYREFLDSHIDRPWSNSSLTIPYYVGYSEALTDYFDDYGD